MKKKLIIGLPIIAVILAAVYFFYWLPSDNRNIMHIIPNDAVFVVTSDEPVSAWKSFSEGPMWSHLKDSPALSYFSQEANSLDSLIKEHDWLNVLGDRQLYVSTHLSANGNQYLYLVDLGKSANLNALSSYLQSMLGEEDFRITEREIRGYEITELYDKEARETLYFFFVGQTLVATYYAPLIEAVIAQAENTTYNQDLMEVADLTGTGGLFRIYFNYDYLPKYINNYLSLGSSLDWLKESLSYTGLTIQINGSNSKLTGFTNFNTKENPYIQALHNAGVSEHNSLKLFPAETPYFLNFGFKSMTLFMEELESAMEKDSAVYNEYNQNVEELEKFLDIDLFEDMYAWMGSELSIFQAGISNRKNTQQLALAISISDKDAAKESLINLQERIKKKTPVKIQSLEYKNYAIQYLAIKGLFRPFFGGMFNQLDKPYFVVIDDWILFSAHPQTLKRVIDKYLAGETLYNNQAFQDYYGSIEDKTSLFCYASLPNVADQLKQLSNAVQQKDFERNREYITSFEHISFQLLNEKQTFETLLSWDYRPPSDTKIGSTLPGQVQQPTAMQESDMEVYSYENELAELDQILIEDLTQRKYEEFYENGELKYEIKLRDGWKHGSFESYYQNGETKYKGKYKEDKKEGTWKLYNIEGDLIKKFEFSEGQLVED